MELTINSIVKYHNRIIQIIRKTDNAVIGRPYFIDSQTGNIEFTIPNKVLTQIKISQIASKSEVQSHLTDIATSKDHKNEEYFDLIGTSHEGFNFEQAVESIKALVDERIKDKLNFNSYKSSKLKYLIVMVTREISAALNIDIIEAKDLLSQKIKLRETI